MEIISEWPVIKKACIADFHQAVLLIILRRELRLSFAGGPLNDGRTYHSVLFGLSHYLLL